MKTAVEERGKIIFAVSDGSRHGRERDIFGEVFLDKKQHPPHKIPIPRMLGAFEGNGLF